MDRELDPKTASLEQARYCRQLNVEILDMEEHVMERVQELMARQSRQVRVERFRRRLAYWTARLAELERPPVIEGC